MARIEKETKGLARPPSITGMTSWEQEVQRICGDFFARSLRPFENEHRRKPFSYGGSAPAVDLYEKRNEVVVKAELPGMEKDDIEIKFRNHQLTIKGEKKREEDAEEADYYIAERFYGSFLRTLDLPSEVQPEKARTTFKNGLLEIHLPKSEQAKKKQIKVQLK